MVKILWPAGNVREALYELRIARQLEEKLGAEVTFITDFRATTDVFREKNVRFITLAELFEKASAEIPAEREALFAKANAILERIDINMLVHGDHVIEMVVKPDTARRLVSKTIIAYDWFFRNHHFDALIRYGGNNINFWAAYILAEKYNIPRFILVHPAAYERCAVQVGGISEQWDWLSFQRLWENAQGKKLSADEKKSVDDFAKTYFERHEQAARSRLVNGLNLQKKIKFWARIKKRVREWKSSLRPPLPVVLDDDDEFLRSPDINTLEVLFENRMQMGKVAWAREYAGFRYDPLPDKYIYFPLNQPYDAPHCAWNPMNFLQEYTASIVQASLPIGYELVVKEHPYSCGFPSHKELRRLQEKGIKVVHPSLHSLGLVKGAAAIFCPGDTTGWEAIIFKRPAVVFCAKPFYVRYPLTITISDPNEVHHALRKAVQRTSLTEDEEESRYAFIYSVLNSSYPGNIWGYKGLIWADQDDSDQNVAKISDMVIAEMELAKKYS